MQISRTDELELLTVLHEGMHEQPAWGTFLKRLLRRAGAGRARLLLARGEAALSTPRGSIEAWLRRSSPLHDGELRIRATGAGGGYSGSRSHLGPREDEQLRAELTRHLGFAVVGLAVM